MLGSVFIEEKAQAAENETDNTNLVDENIHIMNTQDPLVAPNIVMETNNNQHPPPLIPYILTINTMTVTDLRDELSRTGLKNWNKLEIKNRFLHAIKNGVDPFNDAELVEAKQLLRKRSKIQKVSPQASRDEIVLETTNIMNEDGHAKIVEKRLLMHSCFNFMLQVRNKKLAKESSKED